MIGIQTTRFDLMVRDLGSMHEVLDLILSASIVNQKK
jgi:hypothetical protein